MGHKEDDVKGDGEIEGDNEGELCLWGTTALDKGCGCGSEEEEDDDDDDVVVDSSRRFLGGSGVEVGTGEGAGWTDRVGA